MAKPDPEAADVVSHNRRRKSRCNVPNVDTTRGRKLSGSASVLYAFLCLVFLCVYRADMLRAFPHAGLFGGGVVPIHAVHLAYAAVQAFCFF